MIDGTSSVSKDSFKFLIAQSSVADDAEMHELDIKSEKLASDGSVKEIE